MLSSRVANLITMHTAMDWDIAGWHTAMDWDIAGWHTAMDWDIAGWHTLCRRHLSSYIIEDVLTPWLRITCFFMVDIV